MLPWMIAVAALVGLAFIVLLWRRDVRLARHEHERASQALKSAESEFQDAVFQSRAERQTLFNSMIEGVMILDASGRIELINQSLEQQFNLILDVRGLTVEEALRRSELTDLMERLKTTVRETNTEIELSGPPMRRLVAYAAPVLDRNGKPQGGILVFHDVTRLRLLENTRREFVADVSHELRTPLALIKGYAETLLDGAKDDPAVSERFLRKIETHTNRLNNLIEDLLSISKLESGRMTMRTTEISLRDMVRRITDEMQGRAAEKRVVMENGISSVIMVQADPDRLQQVFFNLLDNAVKYGKAGGKIVIEAVESTGGKVQVMVADDGPGIPVEAKERVFERFFRLDKARSRDTGGTGLGLSIVKHIVQSHGGEVWVESAVGEGARFFFTLPRVSTSSNGAS